MPLEKIKILLKDEIIEESNLATLINELDNDLVELFIDKEIYKIYQEKHENGKKTTNPTES